MEWSFYSSVWETPQFYFLCPSKNMFTLIPKRVFANANQETLFRHLSQRKVNTYFETQDTTARHVKESVAHEQSLPPPHEPPDWR